MDSNYSNDIKIASSNTIIAYIFNGDKGYLHILCLIGFDGCNITEWYKCPYKCHHLTPNL